MQPGRPDRVESLVRWQHPERGFVSPMEFIPLAEETGDIHSIGEWVLRTACEQAACWNEDSPIEVAVNVSAKQFHSEGFVSLVARVLEETGLDPSCLELELTESVCVGREEEMIATLQALKALDVRLSMDDFGTGYSSLAYLKRFPIDTLKVDRAFVRELPDSTEDASLVQGIIGMARALGKEVVAEGVETPEQAEMLCRFGAEYLQGYYFGRPVPAEEITRMIHRRGHPIATGAIRPAV
jgi:EAL domain-containing protein (putative c-di-GMP-specific phosphodiesterase class I)